MSEIEDIALNGTPGSLICDIKLVFMTTYKAEDADKEVIGHETLDKMTPVTASYDILPYNQ